MPLIKLLLQTIGRNQGKLWPSCLLPEIRCMLYCAENVIRHKKTISTGSCPGGKEINLCLPQLGPKVRFNCVLTRQLFPELESECVSS